MTETQAICRGVASHLSPSISTEQVWLPNLHLLPSFYMRNLYELRQYIYIYNDVSYNVM